jgi:hypothetical protein
LNRLLVSCSVAALCGAAYVLPAHTSQDGADWAVSEMEQGCRSCHLSDEPPIESAALKLEGLPASPVAGREYPLTITLEDPALQNAGFMLIIRPADAATGGLRAVDDKRVETNGPQARSTWDASFVETPGRASWQVIWTAPESLDAALSFELWGNAGNYDLSPLEDRIYRNSWSL